jgi:hypothetical protein
MATTINEESKIVLIDGTEITVRPLKISLLRDFMKKFEGIQMPGGVTLNGKEIYDEAVEEINKIEEDMFNFNSLPSEIFTG